MVDGEVKLQDISNSENSALDLPWPCVEQLNSTLEVSSPMNEINDNLMVERKSNEVWPSSLTILSLESTSSVPSSSSSSPPLCEERSTNIVESIALLEKNKALSAVPVAPAPEYVPPEKALCAVELECCVAIDKKKVKTVLCVNYMRYGTCKFGSHCAFAHGFDELRPPIDVLLNDKCSATRISTEAVTKRIADNEISPDTVNNIHVCCKETRDKSITEQKLESAFSVPPPSYQESFHNSHSLLLQLENENIKLAKSTKVEHATCTVTMVPSHLTSAAANGETDRNSTPGNAAMKMLTFSSLPPSSSSFSTSPSSFYRSAFASLVPIDSSERTSALPSVSVQQDIKCETCPLDTTFKTPNTDNFIFHVEANACKCERTPFNNNYFTSTCLHQSNSCNQCFKENLRENSISQDSNQQSTKYVVKSNDFKNSVTAAYNNICCDGQCEKVNGIQACNLLHTNERTIPKRQSVKRKLNRVKNFARDLHNCKCNCYCEEELTSKNKYSKNSVYCCNHTTNNKYAKIMTESQMHRCIEWCTNNECESICGGELNNVARVQNEIVNISDYCTENKHVASESIHTSRHKELMKSNLAYYNPVHCNHRLCEQANAKKLMHELENKESKNNFYSHNSTTEECVNTKREIGKRQPVHGKQLPLDHASSTRQECYCKTVSLDEDRNVIVYYGRPEKAKKHVCVKRF